MATLKINPQKLPYRGEPTKDTRPPLPKIPPHLKVRVLDSHWVRRQHDKEDKRRKDTYLKHHAEAQRTPHPNDWTQEQEDRLLQLYQDRVEFPEIAKVLGRTEKAVRTHITKVRRKRRIPKREPDRTKGKWWTDRDRQILFDLANAGYSSYQIAQALDRSEKAIRIMASAMRAEGYDIPTILKKGKHE